MVIALCFVPIKLNLTYLFLYPGILLLLLGSTSRIKSQFREFSSMMRPFYLLMATLCVSALFGVAPLNSIVEVLKLTLLTLAIPCWLITIKRFGHFKCLTLLIASQTIMSLYSVLEYLSIAPEAFLGPVTESGQLGIVIPLALGALLSQRTIAQRRTLPALKSSALLLFTTLILNLKRGPWLGVFSATSYLLYAKRPRWLASFILLTITISIFIDPVRERIIESGQHFTIAGGRQVMWSIASDLITRAPMGIGFGNSQILQDYAREIPPEHKHFHSNFINILVEGGILALMLFLWWGLSMLKTTLYQKNTKDILQLSAGSAILSWLVAGIVEYNFGDSEVLLLLFFTIAYSASSLQSQAKSSTIVS